MSNDGPNLYLPEGQGLIRFPDQDRWILRGDEQRAESFRGAALQLKAGLDQGNVNALNQCSASRRYDDGTVIEVRKNYNFYTMSIYCPPVEKRKESSPVQIVPQLEPDQFFHIPGCVARYGFRQGKELFSEVPIKPVLEISNDAKAAEFFAHRDSGLPAGGVSPDGSLSRVYRLCRLAAADPDSGQVGSRLELDPWHVPTTGPFSVSFIVRLLEPILFDYSFEYRTDEIGRAYTVYNPVKARLLFSDDGQDWQSPCPGSIAPLIGCLAPSRMSAHWSWFNLPWEPWRENFVTQKALGIGYREVGTICDDEPLMASPWAADSPYWDKVALGTLEALEGEFVVRWDENGEVINAAPYTSYCDFRVPGDHDKAIGTRVRGQMEDGSFRYATVSARRTHDGETIFTLLDHQHKLYIADAQPTLDFGQMPFPMCNPKGYMIGMNFLGLAFFNGNRILAGKISDFEQDYELAPIVSDPLELGRWHHVCLTYDDAGTAWLYVTPHGSRTITTSNAMQTVQEFSNTDGFGNALPVSVGAQDAVLSTSDGAPGESWLSQWEFSSSVDLGLMRFYHRALSLEEAKMLTMEAFDSVFVADDHEAGQLLGQGLMAVTV